MTQKAISCAAARAQLPLFVGGDLDDVLASRVGAHLRSCCECRREAGAQLRSVRTLRRAAAETPVPGVDERLFADLRETVLARVAAGAAATELGAPRFGTWRRASVAAAACLLFALGWLAARPEGGLRARGPIQATGASFAPAEEFAAPTLQLLGHDTDWPAGWPVNWPVDDPSFASAGLRGSWSLRTLERDSVERAGDAVQAADEARRERARAGGGLPVGGR